MTDQLKINESPTQKTCTIPTSYECMHIDTNDLPSAKNMLPHQFIQCVYLEADKGQWQNYLLITERLDKELNRRLYSCETNMKQPKQSQGFTMDV